MTDNIIKFPKSKIIQKGADAPVNLEEIKNNIDMVKQTHIQETIALIAPMLFQQLSLAGFELIEEDDDAESIKDSAFLIESIRSILFKYYGLIHPFQKISQNVFDIEESGLLCIKDTLELVLKIDEERV
jgi:hypothetical protein